VGASTLLADKRAAPLGFIPLARLVMTPAMRALPRADLIAQLSPFRHVVDFELESE
jgi:hypothetical protein